MPDRLNPEPVTRRDLLGASGLWAAGVALFGSLVGMAKLAKPRVLPEEGSRFRIGHPEEFQATGERVILERKVIVFSREGAVSAVSLVCTHLGCVVSRTPEGFACPCHGSRFGSEGDVVAGPAPRALRWLEVSRAADGNLVVDAKKEVKPGTGFRV